MKIYFKNFSPLAKLSALAALIIILVAVAGGYYYKTRQASAPLAESGSGYFYPNKDLGFNLTLPVEFDHFQTQRINKDSYVDLEFYIPTADLNYAQQVPPNYAKFLVVRVYNVEKDKPDEGFTALSKRNNHLYAYQFWSQQPVDWQVKWSEQLKANILKSIKLI